MTSYLEIDDGGYYHMQFIDNYFQTFTTFTVETGSCGYYKKVRLISNKEIEINDVWVNVIDSYSYTNGDGEAFGVIGVWEEFVGDTIKVYSGYTDECDNQYIDSLNVIIY